MTDLLADYKNESSPKWKKETGEETSVWCTLGRGTGTHIQTMYVLFHMESMFFFYIDCGSS